MPNDQTTSPAQRAVARLEAIYSEQEGSPILKDQEKWHVEADDILRELLAELGLSEVVEAYDKIDKWFS